MSDYTIFAKLYETEFGQILVVLDTNSDTGKPELKFSYQPADMGVCSTGINYDDTAKGIKASEHDMRNMSEKRAIAVIRKLDEMLQDSMCGES